MHALFSEVGASLSHGMVLPPDGHVWSSRGTAIRLGITTVCLKADLIKKLSGQNLL